MAQDGRMLTEAQVAARTRKPMGNSKANARATAEHGTPSMGDPQGRGTDLPADVHRRCSRSSTGWRFHQGRWCYGKTLMQTFLDSVPLAKEKQLAVA